MGINCPVSGNSWEEKTSIKTPKEEKAIENHRILYKKILKQWLLLFQYQQILLKLGAFEF